MNKMEIVYIDIKDLKPYKHNPRRNDEAVQVVANLTLTNGGAIATRVKYAKKYGAEVTSKASMKPFTDVGAYLAPGFQLRYIKLLSDDVKLNCPQLSYDEIQKQGAGMYLGEKR